MLDDMEVQSKQRGRRGQRASLEPNACLSPTTTPNSLLSKLKRTAASFVPASVNPTPIAPSFSFLYAFASVLTDLPCIADSLASSYAMPPEPLSLSPPSTAPSPQVRVRKR
ncbi:hypothetical protein DFP72DRAFT_1074998 [Ephemerocybe angulata]|uniref:Uncharacterized protein n=1 Tax=Ephemerocybe angulata TaxID=980116 RepID=A0A8H6LYN1_9AGAR|nr:hypothetical protein DFP72DRAFT_1074998 [Tulosesus angulatus]